MPSTIYKNYTNQPTVEEPKKSSKKIIIYLILGIVIIIAIFYFGDLSLTNKKAKSDIDQVQFAVDCTCAAFHASEETDIWDNIFLGDITLDQARLEYPKYYQALEPYMQIVMQKYNLDKNGLEEERRKAAILMHTDSDFKEEVTDIYLQSRCLSRP